VWAYAPGMDDEALPPPAPPSGWYPNPKGEPGLAYWDGDKWADRKPRPRPNSALVIGILATLLLLLVVVTQCGPNRVFVQEPADESPVSTTPSRTPGPAAKAPPSVAPAGSVVRDGTMEFRVENISRSRTVGDPSGNPFLTSTADGEFVVIALSIRNVGDHTVNYFGHNQKLIDADGQAHDAAHDADTIMNAGDRNPMGAIRPGEELRVRLGFDLPPGTPLFALELHSADQSDGTLVRIS
jgi:Domain of unknown function (DUF4352)/Protein of unknown function (DUF2510)